MEIVLAVLLLFGAFTLGSITADQGDNHTQSSETLSNADDVPDSHRVTRAVHQKDPARCQSDGTIIYRDLTVPHHDQIVQPVIEIIDCDGDCPDE